MFIYVLWCFLFLQTVFADKSLIEPCLVTDIECISKSTQIFLDSTSGGIPAYDIRPLDPITIPSIDVTPEGIDGTLHFTNIVVNGFKNQRISSFELDKDSQAVNLKTKIDVVFNSDINVEFHKLSKSFSGTIRGEAKAEGHAQYSFSFKTDDKGVEHYEVGPETNYCQVFGAPKITPNPELEAALEADEDVKPILKKYESKELKTDQETICKIVKAVYVTAIHNIRAAARILPKSAFFKDL